MGNVPSTPGAYRLEKAGRVIYVGSTDNLERRYREHQSDPHNACIRLTGWDNFIWQTVTTTRQAEQLECQWYQAYRPACNLTSPPH